MDGTLVNSNAIVERIWTAWAARVGCNATELLAASHGVPSRVTVTRFAPRGFDVEDELQWFADQENTFADGVVAVAGAGEFLQALKAQDWGIVTSADRKLAQARLEAAGLPIPRLLVCVEDIVHAKPHPEGYLKAAATLNVLPDETVVFEDSHAGVEAGRRMGGLVVGIGTTVPPAQLRQRHGIAAVMSFNELKWRRLKGALELTLPPEH